MLLPEEPILHVGDRLRIVCPEIPELCVDRSVGPDGSLDLPLLDSLVAASRTPSQLAQRILLSLAGTPRIEVRFLGIAKGELEVGGAVEAPLRLYAPRGIDRNRLLKAARLTPDADLTLLSASRKAPPGTILNVPSVTIDRRISVLGAVASPRALPPASNLRLDSALKGAGGLTAHADRNGLIVVRHGEEIPLTLPEDAGFMLQPGDVVRVGLVTDRRYVTVTGFVARPGSVEYAPRMTATQAIAAAGGLLDRANSGTLVWHTGDKSFRLSVAFLLDRRIPDPVLGPNDSLVLEASRP